MHATGIPLDYRLPSDRFRADDPLFQQFLGYHRGHGEAIIPALPDTPQLTVDQRVECYEAELRRVRQLVPDPDGAHSRESRCTIVLTPVTPRHSCGWE